MVKMTRLNKRNKRRQKQRSDVENAFDLDDEEFEVESIMDKRTMEDGSIEYYVKWVGYDEPTWEPSQNVQCADLIAAYEDKLLCCVVCLESAKDDGRTCDACGALMHHFCSHDIAEKVGLTDFGNFTYCSTACYSRTRSMDHSDEETKDEETPSNKKKRSKNPHSDEEEYTDQPSKKKKKAKKGALKSKKKQHSSDAPVAEEDDGFERVAGTPFLLKPLRKPTPKPNNGPPTMNPVEDLVSPKGIPLKQMYLNKEVAFCPGDEDWMKPKDFRDVGSTYLIAIVKRFIPKQKTGVSASSNAPVLEPESSQVQTKSKKQKVDLYELCWIDSKFQTKIYCVPFEKLLEGREHFARLQRDSQRSKLSWKELTAPDSTLEELPPDDLGDLEVEYVNYEVHQQPPSTVREVETMENFRFDRDGQLGVPADLFTHPDGTTVTRVKEEYKHLFQHSAIASFFAYLPKSFWKQVVCETNENAKKLSSAAYDIRKPFTMSEMMKFIGLLLSMQVVDRGEYANYWGVQAESFMYNTTVPSADAIMSLRRFKALRAALSFKAICSREALKRDPAARIRPLLNILKKTGPKYVDLGRNISLDEASVACRSKFGRGLIVFKPKKPTGKYHFKLYVISCASSWIAINYRLHCDTDMLTRLDGVVETDEAASLHQETADTTNKRTNVSETRRNVLEVIRPLYGSKRIVNCDNYYTSVQLLESMKLKGVYGRGTIKRNSAHFPAHVLLPDPSKRVRGDTSWGVDEKNKILAVSWCDGNIVNMISNADASEMGCVTRTVKQQSVEIPAPTCIKEYNQYMQGVDRLDQLRSRFSISDGHSFKKWHLKLAMAIIDIARLNAFMTRKLVMGADESDRDPHRTFVLQLIRELNFGAWEMAPSDAELVYTDNIQTPTTPTMIPQSRVPPRSVPSTENVCKCIASKQVFQSRKKRRCVICRWEGRPYPTQVTDYCTTHKVCLCKNVYGSDPLPHLCQETELTCWQKFHRFYFPAGLYSDKGNLKKTSALYKLGHPTQDSSSEVNDSPFSLPSRASTDFVGDSPEPATARRLEMLSPTPNSFLALLRST